MVQTINNNGIASISMKGISLIEDNDLRDALLSVYKTPYSNHVLQTTEKVFKKLTSKKWEIEILYRFLSGWRSSHGTALFVSGLIIRILRTASDADETSQKLFYKVATELGEIIPEDTGVDDRPHNELFMEFANNIAGSDNWQLKNYMLPSCEAFRNYVKNQRLKAPIEEAILTTAASENWNTGEYTFFTKFIHHWMNHELGLPLDTTNNAATYVVVHSGNTELGHFLHAINAWKIYCNAINKFADPNFAKNVFKNYIEAIGNVYNELDALFC